MAVEIIEKGELPESKRYQTRCIRCKTLFSFQRKDATYWSSVRNEEGLKDRLPGLWAHLLYRRRVMPDRYLSAGIKQ